MSRWVAPDAPQFMAWAERAGGSTPSAASPMPLPAAMATLTKPRLFHRGWPPGRRRRTGSAPWGRGPVREGMSADTVASVRTASPSSTRVEAFLCGESRERLKEADRDRHLRRSGHQVEDAKDADRQMQQCRRGSCRTPSGSVLHRHAERAGVS